MVQYFVFPDMYVCVRVCVCVYGYVCMCVHMCVHMCVCVCVEGGERVCATQVLYTRLIDNLKSNYKF